MSRTAIRMITGVLLTAAVLAGCSARPGAAAVVDDRVIGQSDLQQALDDLGPILSSQDPSGLLYYLIVAPDFVQAAADNGVGVSEDDGRAVLDGAFASSDVTPPTQYSDASLLLGEQAAASNQLSQLTDAAELIVSINATVADREVTINPQYGQWDPTGVASGAGIVANSFPWLAGAQPTE